jgi:hypothetical protein
MATYTVRVLNGGTPVSGATVILGELGVTGSTNSSGILASTIASKSGSLRVQVEITYTGGAMGTAVTLAAGGTTDIEV